MGGCNVVAILSIADMVCLECIYAETVEYMSVLGLYGILEFKL